MILDNKIIIHEAKKRIWAILLNEKDEIADVKVCRLDSVIGNIYAARVVRISKELKACFAEIAPGENVFIKFSELSNVEKIKQGDIIPVQITKDKHSTKDYSGTGNFLITGRYFVISKGTGKVNFSKKIRGEKKHEALLNKISSVRPSEKIDIIFRTASVYAKEAELIAEYNELSETLINIIEYGNMRTAYSKLYSAVPDYIRFIYDNWTEGAIKIITSHSQYYEAISLWFKNSEDIAVQLYSDRAISLNTLYKLDNRIEELISKKVYLKCGGYLIIEATEAFNVIDVNSGKCIQKKETAEFIKLINKEAAKAAARNIMLRNLSGIILIDFINTDSEGEKELISIMNEELKKDKAKPCVIDITGLGIMEITRKRTGNSLEEELKSH